MTLLRSAPLRRQSVKAKARALRLQNTKRAVLSRAHYNCEMCGAQRVRLDLHHVTGRGNVIGQPWCDIPELCLALCRECHRAVELSPAAMLAARLTACRRFWAVYNRARPAGNPLDQIRELVRDLEARGITPSPGSR